MARTSERSTVADHLAGRAALCAALALALLAVLAHRTALTRGQDQLVCAN